MRRILVAAMLAPLICQTHDGWGQTESMQATAVEIAQLPTFCWAQFRVPNASGDEFRIQDCGPAANHYCGALIYLIRARHVTNKSLRLDLVRNANEGVTYTERAIKDYPKCSIRQDVASTRVEVNNLLRMYGAKPASAR